MLMIDVAKELAEYFIDIDLSPTDIMAGLILV
jgi:fructose-1,6-bisphosphatase/inositol monophosphatase family enzyme